MAVFNFDQVDDYVQGERGSISFFKLQDHGFQAKVRFMYGPGETFQGYSVHNIGTDGKNKYVPCLREPGQPLDTCPLCNAGMGTQAIFFIPLYVISITKCINGRLQQEEEVNQVMVFQRGKTFAGSLASAVRQSAGTPLVSNIFNIVRNGKAGDTQTNYVVEFVNRDNTTLESLPERPEILGSFVLPDMKYQEMAELVAQRAAVPQGVMPRQVVANNYQTGNYQAPNTAPRIPF